MPRLNAFTNRIIVGKGLIRNFIFNKIISSNTQNYNLRNDAVAAGWNGISPLVATITVNSGVYVWSDDTAIAGFDTGSNFLVGTTLSIINNGFIIGRGGNGVYRANGTAGGPAMNIGYPVSITNNSYIAGGGGGGGSTGGQNVTYYIASGGGGAGGGEGGSGIDPGTGGAGGAPGLEGGYGIFYVNSNGTVGWSAGGGGGRILPGVGGPATIVTAPLGFSGRKNGAPGGGAGGAGGVGNLFATSMPGGAGGSANNPGTTGIFTSGLGVVAGGGGGGWGASGGNSFGTLTGTDYTSAGAGGKAVNLNGNTVTWLANGTRWGAIS
jgi:hypothetical protein